MPPSHVERLGFLVLKAFAGGTVFGECWGDEEPWVLALHGWRRDRGDFTTLFDPGSGLAGIALDLPGFGATPPPPQPWGAADYAEAIFPVLEEFPGPPVVIGHSFGGRVAVALAAAHPDAVGALVLTGVPLVQTGASTRRRPPARFRLARAAHARGFLGEARMEALRQRYGSPDYRHASGVMRQVLVRSVNETYEAELGRIACPVEMVWGDDDAETPLAVAKAAAGLLRQADSVAVNLTVCPGAGHMTPLSVPEVLRQAAASHRPPAHRP